MNKLAQHILDELSRISFFLRNANVIEDYFAKTTRSILLGLPVKWDDKHVLIHGKKPEDATEDDYFESIGARKKLPIDIEIKGTVSDRPFTLKIKYGDNAHDYILEFDDGSTFGKNKKIRSMESIKEIIENIASGKDHTEKDLSELYKTFFKGISKYDKIKKDIISKFFGDYTDLNWVMKPFIDLQKGGDIKLRIYTTEAEPEEYSDVFKMMTETDPSRSSFKVTNLLQSKIPEYLGSLFKDAGYDVDVSVRGVMKPTVSEEGKLSGNLGFTVTIK